MNDRPDLLLCLLDGLDPIERRFVLDQISSAHSEQLERRRHPPRRRRRNADGELVWPEDMTSGTR
jgi:hypothetical protein